VILLTKRLEVTLEVSIYSVIITKGYTSIIPWLVGHTISLIPDKSTTFELIMAGMTITGINVSGYM
jgi:hypothetical protein